MGIEMPGIFNFDQSSEDNEETEVGKLILNANEDITATSMGDIDDLTKDPGLIEREMVPICEFIDYGVFSSINPDICYTQLKNYCLETLSRSNMSNHVCDIPSTTSFECILDIDCSSSVLKRCVRGQCAACVKDSDCGNPRNRCNSANRCYREPSYPSFTDAGCVEKRDTEHHWTSCVYGPDCPHGYFFKRYSNGPCTFGTKRKVCYKYTSDPYFGPPCKKLLKGTCGAGKRGNGCCDNGARCSKWGWCGRSNAYKTDALPTYENCRTMMGMYN